VLNGRVVIQYDPANVLLGVGDIRTAQVQVLPANAAGDRIGSRTCVTAPVILSSAGTLPGNVTVLPASVLADGADRRVVVTVSDIMDSTGNPVPDGTKVAVTARDLNLVTPDNCCFISSARGTILNGTAAPADARFRFFTVQGGTISIDVQAPAQANVTSTLQLLPALPDGNRIGSRTFAVKAIAITP